jgi:hypothetical protein
VKRHLLRAALAAILLAAAACRPASLSIAPAGPTAALSERFALEGVATFDDRTAQIAPDELTRLATITLIDAANQTVATTRTDAAGAFTLLPGSSFTAAAGDVFFLDAYKGTHGNAIGADLARMRTILQWTAAGWKSVSGAGVVINPLTTAVSVIQGLQPGSVSTLNTLDTVSGSSVTTANGTLNGNWSSVYALVRELLGKDQDPLARIVYRDGAFRVASSLAAPVVIENFRTGTFAETQMDASGRLLLGAPKPTPNDPASEIETFQAAGVAPNAAASLTTDGTYLYVKSWANWGLHNTTNQLVKKIGTGFNGTVRGANYGTLGTPVPAINISLAYHRGYLYLPMAGKPNQLFQISTANGATASIDIPVTLYPYYESTSAAIPVGTQLITTDGRYFYNLSSTVEAPTSAYNGYFVQVLDPDQGFQLVRKFTLDTASFYTDGIFCDGTYLWPIEWTGSTNVARIRRYRLADNTREAEWTFLRDTIGAAATFYAPQYNNPINGCWDPYNRVFWIGELTNERIHMLRGGNFIPSGTWTSAAIDSGAADPHYGRLAWVADDAGTGSQLGFQVRSADTTGALAAATWYGPSGTTDSYTMSGTPLNAVHAKHRYLQVRGIFRAANDLLTSPTLSQLSVGVLP